VRVHRLLQLDGIAFLGCHLDRLDGIRWQRRAEKLQRLANPGEVRPQGLPLDLHRLRTGGPGGTGQQDANENGTAPGGGRHGSGPEWRRATGPFNPCRWPQSNGKSRTFVTTGTQMRKSAPAGIPARAPAP
jgi:hypothetical protein